MSEGTEWLKEVDELGEFWVNENIGSIMKTNERKFLVLVPKIVQLGPFETLEEAQEKAIEAKNVK